jgi:hypothetical protein
MPSEHEPIDATVKDGVARADMARGDAPPGRGAAPRGGSWGCLVVPVLLGVWSLVVGIWRMTQWDMLPGGATFGAVVLTGFGLAVVGAAVLAIWLMLKLRRLMRTAQRDMASLVEQMKYMANAGRAGGAGGAGQAGRRTVENEAEDAPPVTAGALLEGEAPEEADAPADVPDPLDDQPLGGAGSPPGEEPRDGPDARGM